MTLVKNKAVNWIIWTLFTLLLILASFVYIYATHIYDIIFVDKHESVKAFYEALHKEPTGIVVGFYILLAAIIISIIITFIVQIVFVKAAKKHKAFKSTYTLAVIGFFIWPILPSIFTLIGSWVALSVKKVNMENK